MWHNQTQTIGGGPRALAINDARVMCVPSDGDCLLTAVALELGRCLGRPPAKNPGAGCRQVCVKSVRRGLQEEWTLHGLPLRDASIAATGFRQPAEYLQQMEKPAAGRESWGGFLEAALLTQHFQVPLIIWEQCEQGYRCLAGVRGGGQIAVHRRSKPGVLLLIFRALHRACGPARIVMC